jgi:hypothetical protein
MITGCEACSETAEIPFDNILDRVTGSDPTVNRNRGADQVFAMRRRDSRKDAY